MIILCFFIVFFYLFYKKIVDVEKVKNWVWTQIRVHLLSDEDEDEIKILYLLYKYVDEMNLYFRHRNMIIKHVPTP